MIISFIRKYIGIFVAFLGFILLVILTFGDIADIMTEAYWQNVRDNLTAIGFTTISLTLIQTVIKQGLSEQALQRGLNTEKATEVYKTHRELIKNSVNKMLYLPYFLHSYNKRNTTLRKRDFLVTNGFASESALYATHNKRVIRMYNKIQVVVTSSSIKWATTDIKYDKTGRIETLASHRAKRILVNIVASFACMFAVAFLTRGLFFSDVEEPLVNKFVKLLTYVVSIAIGSVLGIVKEYEKGAFGVPNALEEINEIWIEFSNWKAPDWVEKEIKELEEETLEKANDIRADVQEKQEIVETV